MWGQRLRQRQPDGAPAARFSVTHRRISGRNQRNQVTSIQKTEAIRDVQGSSASKAGLGKFLFGVRESG